MNHKKWNTRVRSDVWLEYTRVLVREGDSPVERPKAKCNLCSRYIAVDPNKHDTIITVETLYYMRSSMMQTSLRQCLTRTSHDPW